MSSYDVKNEKASSYLSGGNLPYIEDLYEDYLKDKASVSSEWQEIFNSLPINGSPDVSHRDIQNYFLKNANKKPASIVIENQDNKQAQVANLVNSYRAYGHLAATLDPLELMQRPEITNLDLASHGLSEKDLNQLFSVPTLFPNKKVSLAEIIKSLREAYCGSIGVEYMHIADAAEIDWFQYKMESVKFRQSIDVDKKKKLLRELIAADGLERYLGTRYVGQKRFSLEGGDALVPIMKELLREGEKSGVKEIVIGMAHRGRLNVLINVLGKSPAELFQEFEGKYSKDRTGDVKYHLGFSSDLRPNGKGNVHVSLAFNPSHLEIIAPVVQGSARSRLRRRNDLLAKNTVLPIIIHGDAAFAGQGVVMETFNFSQARGYCTGGSIHLVINNQVGFTTSNPLDSRSTLYCTDVAKVAQAPVIHVNGDDIEAVAYATQLALEFRMKFKRDVVVDLVCYRRQGHNEADEPSVTQPLMYQKIKAMHPLKEIYAQELIKDGYLTKDEFQQEMDAYRDKLDRGEAIVQTFQEDYTDQIKIDWMPYLHASWSDKFTTSVTMETLQKLSKIILTLPEGFDVHPVVKRLLIDREKMTAGEMLLNWGYAETMAYATLLNEGHEVRLSGQDCGRGTFAHRHAQLHDQSTGEFFVPLEKLATSPSKPFTVIDSVLSEEAVLAFEYGYSASEPTSLVLWEAQFGDFANGAQVVMDQFISSGEQKWGRLCGLVMLLPHGYEGQGPEHSSARLERYLQLCAEENMQVCTPTTPAQIFHLLRRQIKRNIRKPLIVMTPKSLLRHKLAVSTLTELTTGEFQEVISEIDSLNEKEVKRVVLCGGKVYYDLLQKRRDQTIENIALVRIEQLYPFPKDALTQELKKYPNIESVVWCQEEPKNQGSWFSLRQDMLECIPSHVTFDYVGRSSAAAPAVGSHYLHVEQQEALVNNALAIK